MLYFGLDLINTWLVAVRRKLSRVDYGIVLFIVLVTGVFGFMEGVAAGLVASMIFFVVRAGRVDVVAETFTGRDRLSKRSWSVTQRAILRDQGERISTYRLRGYIFFGSAISLGDRLKLTLETDPVPQCLLLDFTTSPGWTLRP